MAQPAIHRRGAAGGGGGEDARSRRRRRRPAPPPLLLRSPLSFASSRSRHSSYRRRHASKIRSATTIYVWVPRPRLGRPEPSLVSSRDAERVTPYGGQFPAFFILFWRFVACFLARPGNENAHITNTSRGVIARTVTPDGTTTRAHKAEPQDAPADATAERKSVSWSTRSHCLSGSFTTLHFVGVCRGRSASATSTGPTSFASLFSSSSAFVIALAIFPTRPPPH